MNRIKKNILSFAQRGGIHIFSSTILSKIAAFVLSILIVRILSQNEYGLYSYALSIMMILLPLSGLGLHHSLLRFASIEKNEDKKNDLFASFLSIGLIGSIALSLVIVLFSDLITAQLPGAAKYLRILSPLVLTFYISELLFSYFRSKKDNQTYAYGMLLKSLLLLVLCYVMSIKFGASGYAVSYVLVPFIVSLFLLVSAKKKYNLVLKPKSKISINKYLKYGLWVGLGAIISKLVFMMDTIMVGNILADSKQLALYKVATIIPVNLIIIPSILLRTDFVYIAEKYQDKNFLVNYYKKYLLILSVVLIVVLSLWFAFSSQIVSIFGSQYSGVESVITILFIMLIGSFLFRIPLGNILSALGKSKWNALSNLMLVLENFILNFILIPKFGIIGAAIASAISIWTSAVINVVLFKYYLDKYCELSK